MRYTESHEWVDVSGTRATMGITDKAQKELGDIVYVELPVVGATVKQQEAVVVLESTKAAIDIYSPLSGRVVEINTSLREHPEKINESAEKEGWLFKLDLTHPEEVDALKNSEP